MDKVLSEARRPGSRSSTCHGSIADDRITQHIDFSGLPCIRYFGLPRPPRRYVGWPDVELLVGRGCARNLYRSVAGFVGQMVVAEQIAARLFEMQAVTAFRVGNGAWRTVESRDSRMLDRTIRN